jgi:hypothetical protein
MCRQIERERGVTDLLRALAADIGSEYGDNVADSVDFLMLNFAGETLT